MYQNRLNRLDRLNRLNRLEHNVALVMTTIMILIENDLRVALIENEFRIVSVCRQGGLVIYSYTVNCSKHANGAER